MRALFSIDYPPGLMLSVKTYNSYSGLIVLIVFLCSFSFPRNPLHLFRIPKTRGAGITAAAGTKLCHLLVYECVLYLLA